MVVDYPPLNQSSPQQEVESQHLERSRSRLLKVSPQLLLNILIGVFLFLIVYLSYALVMHRIGEISGEDLRAQTTSGKPVQLDVLNGCGVPRIASKFTSFLRRQGFDVVEMRNYRTFDMQKTLVVDRVGNLALARKVARALGVHQNNIIQEINPDYFVDVSVVIGKDYLSLPVMK